MARARIMKLQLIYKNATVLVFLTANQSENSVRLSVAASPGLWKNASHGRVASISA